MPCIVYGSGNSYKNSIIVAVLSQVLSRAGRDDYALITVLAGIAAVLIMLLPYLSQLLDAVNGMLGG